MAHIVDFSITGLAGRKRTYHQILDRHINVFFGLNGSGKTSLLRILNSAMNVDSSTLLNVPFRSAEVKIYSVNYERIFTYTLEKKIVKRSTSETARALDSDAISDASQRRSYRNIAIRPDTESAKLPDWTVAPKAPEEMVMWAHTYLPTSRLYVGEREFVSRYDTEDTSEDTLDRLFASSLQSIWRDYNTEIVGSINQAQQDGLANILKAVLSGEKRIEVDAKPVDITTAYNRMSSFLERQGSRDIIGALDKFESEYKRNKQLRSVVRDIDVTESKITEIMAPRNELEGIIQRMFSGRKKIQFEEMLINVITDDKEDIGVNTLSSGEKHALLLYIEALRVGVCSILIDEPEISMHIDWQRDFVSTMHQLNPSAQMILATHSPDIMADVEDERIFRL